MYSTLFLEAADVPVTIKSISMIPVVGSMADCFNAYLINSYAIVTSLTSTILESFIFAKD